MELGRVMSIDGKRAPQLREAFIVFSVGIYAGRIFAVYIRSTALRFTATGAPLAARSVLILSMNQNA
jgi:hypothetical protein